MLAKIGVSYKIAPLATLDAITLRDLPPFYKILRSIPGIKGTVVVQTCNRVDMFIDANDGAEIIEKILWNWALQTKFKLHELKRIAEQRTGEQVLEYLVSLASGLESMLVGESQILGQLKSSLIEARGLAASSLRYVNRSWHKNPGPNRHRTRNSISRVCSIEGRGSLSWKSQRCQGTVARNGPDRHGPNESTESKRNQ